VDPWFSLFPKLALAYGLILNGKVDDARQYIVEIAEFCEEFGAEFAGKPALFSKGSLWLDKARDCFTESVAYFRLCGSDVLSK
jgi:hypothetical protein